MNLHQAFPFIDTVLRLSTDDWLVVCLFYGTLLALTVISLKIIEGNFLSEALFKLEWAMAHLRKMKIDRGRQTPTYSDVKLAIFGDVLGNLEALQAVIADARIQGCNHFACVGDIVGRYANPNECIKLLRKLDCPVVLGDLDSLVAHKRKHLSPYTYNPREISQIKWTRKALSRSNRRWLKRLPYVWRAYRSTFVHSSLARPERFNMVDGRQQAWESLYFQRDQPCFYGHAPSVHTPKEPLTYIRWDGRLTCHSGDLETNLTGSFMMNVGSIGGANFHATYVIYNQESERIETRRVATDRSETIRKMTKAKLN
jgi:hypothetical protein